MDKIIDGNAWDWYSKRLCFRCEHKTSSHGWQDRLSRQGCKECDECIGYA